MVQWIFLVFVAVACNALPSRELPPAVPDVVTAQHVEDVQADAEDLTRQIRELAEKRKAARR